MKNVCVLRSMYFCSMLVLGNNFANAASVMYDESYPPKDDAEYSAYKRTDGYSNVVVRRKGGTSVFILSIGACTLWAMHSGPYLSNTMSTRSIPPDQSNEECALLNLSDIPEGAFLLSCFLAKNVPTHWCSRRELHEMVAAKCNYLGIDATKLQILVDALAQDVPLGDLALFATPRLIFGVSMQQYNWGHDALVRNNFY